MDIYLNYSNLNCISETSQYALHRKIFVYISPKVTLLPSQNTRQKSNAAHRTVQISGRSHAIGSFGLYRCKGILGTAALHIFCNQVSKMCKRKCVMNLVGFIVYSHRE